MDATVGIWADAVYGVVRNDDREVPLVRKLGRFAVQLRVARSLAGMTVDGGHEFEVVVVDGVYHRRIRYRGDVI